MSNTQVALVTGARSGVGLELTKALLARGTQVLALVKSPLPDEPELSRAASQGHLRTYLADLSDAASLARAIDAITTHEPRIDTIFNNAGVSPETLQFSPQGNELCFEVNTLAPYRLATALAPLLAAGTRRRIVNTGSNAALTVRAYDPATLARPRTYRKLFGAYAQSKLALSLWTQAASADFAAQGITMVSVDPGGNRTAMTASAGMPWYLKLPARWLFTHPSVGAGLLLDAAGDGPIDNGAFMIKGKATRLPFSAQAMATLALVRGHIAAPAYPSFVA